MKIDLHVHTSPRSPCSDIQPETLVAEAKRIGLDGFCLTEHQVLWSEADVKALAKDSGIAIFRGNEITTAQGDVLVFGLEEDIQGIIPIQALHQAVIAAGAFAILAHPFRGFKTFGLSDLQMDIEQASRKKALGFVQAVEIRNGKVTDRDNTMAEKVADRLNLPGTGGSDAHHLDSLGRFVTIFEQPLRTDRQLLEALHSGRFALGTCR